MLPLPTEAPIEEKTNTCTDPRLPTYHWRPHIIPESLDSDTKAHHNQHRRRRGDGELSKGKGSFGSLTCLSHIFFFFFFFYWTLDLGCSHAMSIQFGLFDVRCLDCRWNNGLFRSKNKHHSITISEDNNYLTARACGKRAVLGHCLANRY